MTGPRTTTPDAGIEDHGLDTYNMASIRSQTARLKVRQEQGGWNSRDPESSLRPTPLIPSGGTAQSLSRKAGIGSRKRKGTKNWVSG